MYLYNSTWHAVRHFLITRTSGVRCYDPHGLVHIVASTRFKTLNMNDWK